MLDSRQSFATNSLRQPGQDREELLGRALPYVAAYDDQTIILRDGDVMASFAVDGISASTSDEQEVDEIATAFAYLIAQQMPDVGFYVHRISAQTSPSLYPVDENTPFAKAIDERWQGFLGIAGLRNRTTLVTITIRPSKVVGLWAKLTGGKEQIEDQLQRRVVRLNQIITAVMETLSKTSPQRMTVSSGDWLGLLAATITGEVTPITPRRNFIPLNDQISKASVLFHSDTFTVLGSHSLNTRFGAILTLKDYPSVTFAGILDGLDLASDTVVTNSFTPTDKIEALQKIQRIARQMAASEDAARSLQHQLEQAADDQASGRVTFGNLNRPQFAGDLQPK